MRAGDDPLRLESARAAVARLDGYIAKRASDRKLTDAALREIATRYPRFWLKGPLTQEEKIRFVQGKDGCSREDTEKHLAQVARGTEELARIFGDAKA